MYFLKSRLYILVLIILTAIFLNTVSCNKQDNTVSNLTDSLILPMTSLIHVDLSDSLTEPVKVKFRILKGTQIISITPQISYFNLDSILCDSPLNYPVIEINELNHFYNLDSSINLGQQAFINDFYRINGGLTNFRQGDQWIINFMVSMNDGRYLRNRYNITITWDNYFSGVYNDHIIYHKPGSGIYPNDVHVDSSFVKDIIALNKLESVTDFALWENSGIKMNLFPWATDTITLTVSGWKYPVMNGDPNNSSLITHIDEKSDKVNKIYLYYYFKDSTGNNNIFWETLTPQ